MFKKPQTNIELVTKMMEFSKAGGLKQVFIIEAIRDYSERTLKFPEWENSPLISQEAWNLCAKECLTEIDRR